MKDTCKALKHLTVYITEDCNLKCKYCYVNQNDIELVNEKKILKQIAYFIANTGKQRKITFLGGEPLIHEAVLKKSIIYARKLDEHMPLRVFTNSTLLNKKWLEFFEKFNVAIAISLDGNKRVNDFARIHKVGNKSVYNEVLKNIPDEYKKNITVCATLLPDNASILKENIIHLVSKGFYNIGWSPDITSFWSKENLRSLEQSANVLLNIYVQELKKGNVLFNIANLYETLFYILYGKKQKKCDSITLTPSGIFLPCDKLMSVNLERRKCFEIPVGEKGFDLRKRNKFFTNVNKNGAEFSCNSCLIGPYVYLSGLAVSDKEKDKIFQSQKKLSKLVNKINNKFARNCVKYNVFKEAHFLG